MTLPMTYEHSNPRRVRPPAMREWRRGGSGGGPPTGALRLHRGLGGGPPAAPLEGGRTGGGARPGGGGRGSANQRLGSEQ